MSKFDELLQKVSDRAPWVFGSDCTVQSEGSTIIIGVPRNGKMARMVQNFSDVVLYNIPVVDLARAYVLDAARDLYRLTPED